MDNQNTKAKECRFHTDKKVLILVLMDNQNTDSAKALAEAWQVLILVLMDNQNTNLNMIVNVG